MLVWVCIDFWACSPSPIIHSVFTLKVKHLIPLFRSPVLSSAPAKCGCSTSTEVLQRRRQCQECLREVSVGREGRESEAQGWGCRQCWGVSHRDLQSLLLFKCVFYRPDLLLPPNYGAVPPAFALTVRNKPDCSTSSHMGCSQTAHKDFSPSCPMLKEAGSSIIPFPCIFLLLSYFLFSPLLHFLPFCYTLTTILLCLSFLEVPLFHS